MLNISRLGRGYRYALAIIGLAFVTGEPSAAPSQADQKKAIAYYMQAEAAYESEAWSDALSRLGRVVELLDGRSNARIESLRVKAHYGAGDLAKAKRALTRFYQLEADAPLAREMSGYLVRIDEELGEALYTAARDGDVDEVRTLLNAGVDVDVRASGVWTPLLAAARNTGDAETVEALLEAGADTSLGTQDGWTPLHVATRYGNPAMVAALAASGADPNAVNDGGMTPLLLGIRSGTDIAIIEALLVAGADPNAMSDEGWVALHYATRYGKDPAVIEALLAAGAAVDARNNGEWTPLHLATRYAADIATVEALLAAGADVNSVQKNGWGALHLAARNAEPEVVALLLAAGADAAVPLPNGWSVLQLTKKRDDTAAATRIACVLGDRKACIATTVPEPIGSVADVLQYPAQAFAEKIEGTVHLLFYVEPDGTVSEIEVKQDIGGGCGEAAIAALKRMSFKPATQGGRPVRARATLAFTFALPE